MLPDRRSAGRPADDQPLPKARRRHRRRLCRDDDLGARPRARTRSGAPGRAGSIAKEPRHDDASAGIALPPADKGGHQARAEDVAGIGARQPQAGRPQDACSLCSEPALSSRGGLPRAHDRGRRRPRSRGYRVGTDAALTRNLRGVWAAHRNVAPAPGREHAGRPLLLQASSGSAPAHQRLPLGSQRTGATSPRRYLCRSVIVLATARAPHSANSRVRASHLIVLGT